MMQTISTAKLNRLKELEQLLVTRAKVELEPTAAGRVLKLAEIRLKMFDHLERHKNVYQQAPQSEHENAQLLPTNAIHGVI